MSFVHQLITFCNSKSVASNRLIVGLSPGYAQIVSSVYKRKHTAQFKFEVAMKAVSSSQMAEVARVYGVNTGQVSKWVSYLKTQGACIFSTRPDPEKAVLLT